MSTVCHYYYLPTIYFPTNSIKSVKNGVSLSDALLPEFKDNILIMNKIIIFLKMKNLYDLHFLVRLQHIIVPTDRKLSRQEAEPDFINITLLLRCTLTL